MSSQLADNRRIAKNTLYLYLRMILTTVVSLYTVRVVLDILGPEDYGIYNVVGGVVILFSFLNHAMSGATQRFLSYEIGRNDDEMFRKTFSMSINCHVILAGAIFFLLETIGLWFLSAQMNIPDGRMTAAHWVYQFSILTFILNILRVPFNASIISFEKMSFYAYLSIVEVLLNLVIVFMLLLGIGVDKLILFSGLKCLISAICLFVSYIYCGAKFSNCKYTFFWDNTLFRKLFSFSGWSMLGAGSTLISQNGSNILINIYCGVAVNAAYGIANQVSSVIYSFVSNFQLAFRPQIVKLYAAGKREEQISLVNRASAISYYLLLIIFIPFVLNADFVLGLWLKDVPEYAVEFCQLMLAYSLIDAIQAPLWMSITATGNIKNYSIWSSALAVLNIPIAWLLLSCGYSPIFVFVVRFIINFIAAVIRILYVKRFLNFPVKKYINMVFIRIIPVTLITFGVSYYINSLFADSIILFLVKICLIVLFIILIVFILGLSLVEKRFVIQLIKSKISGNVIK